jgi:large subunit ribosomal protein L4
VVDELNDNLYLSLRNLEKVQSCALTDLNTYDIINAEALVLTEGAARIFVDETEVAEKA